MVYILHSCVVYMSQNRENFRGTKLSNWFLTDRNVYCAVRTESLNKIQLNLSFKGLIQILNQVFCLYAGDTLELPLTVNGYKSVLWQRIN